jgi:IS1 family transposase
MYTLSLEKRVKVVRLLTEGNSIRGTSRLTGVAKGTILRLLKVLGKACEEYQAEALCGLGCTQIQCDEIWSFCYMKNKNIPESQAKKLGIGNVWTWVALCPDTRLACCWLIGERNLDYAVDFLTQLQNRLFYKAQISTDGLILYQEAMAIVFGKNVDFAMLDKNIVEADGKKSLSIHHRKVTGNPDMEKLSTSYIERQNLTMRTQMKRFTRRTNAFSKKIENLRYAVALHFMYYNFCRAHPALNKERNLGITPAMAEDAADHRWTIEEVVQLLESN